MASGQKTKLIDASDNSASITRYFRVTLSELAYLRFILEGYEGLVVMTSLPSRDEVQWTIPVQLAEEANRLALHLANELTLVPIPRPADWPDAMP